MLTLSKDKLLLIWYVVLDTYRVFIGSFYSVFVPQLCDSNTNNYTCSIADNFTNLSIYNKFVLSFNVIAAFVLIVAFIFEYYREHWIRKHFDKDEAKPVDNLETEIQSYKYIKNKLLQINYIYFLLFNMATICSVINIIISGFLIGQYYGGLQTATTFITNTLIISFRLIKTLEISYIHRDNIHRDNTTAKSVFLLVPTQFNIISPAFQRIDANAPIYENIIKETSLV